MEGALRDAEPGKVCARCLLWVPLRKFPLRKDRPGGYAYTCKECFAEGRRTPEKIERSLARSVAWKKANPDKCRQHYLNKKANFPEKLREQSLKRKYSERRRERNKLHYAENREAEIAKSQAYAKAHPEIVNANNARRRARRKNAEGSFTNSEWFALCEKHGGKCLCCGAEAPMSIDHVVPLSKGGSNYISNIQPLCKSCNSSKHDKCTDYR